MNITFSPRQFWDIDQKSIVFHANADGKQIQCVVPQEFLTAPLVENLSEEEARQLFCERRGEIASRLRDEIHEQGLDCLSEIVLRP